MPNIEEMKTFPKETPNRLLSVHRKDILFREDLSTGFFYAIAGIGICLAVAGGVYVIGKQLLK